MAGKARSGAMHGPLDPGAPRGIPERRRGTPARALLQESASALFRWQPSLVLAPSPSPPRRARGHECLRLAEERILVRPPGMAVVEDDVHAALVAEGGVYPPLVQCLLVRIGTGEGWVVFEADDEGGGRRHIQPGRADELADLPDHDRLCREGNLDQP